MVNVLTFLIGLQDEHDVQKAKTQKSDYATLQ